jgi:hypothetical protein
MTQNTSSAVMQQRAEAHDSLDDFPTPPWATRALFEHVIIPNVGSLPRHGLKMQRCWEPCANRGYMYLPLKEYFAFVAATDIFDYGMGYYQHDFLMPYMPGPIDATGVDWIITNPPFRLALDIIKRGIEVSRVGVAVLVRTSFEEGTDRYKRLFQQLQPSLMGAFTERVIIHKGILRDPSKQYWNPKGRNKETGKKTGAWQKPSTATSYKWMVWIRGMSPRPQIWIPPCRQQLERPGDYPNV